MNKFPLNAAHVGVAHFSRREKLVGPDDEEEDEEENYVSPQDDDGPDDDDSNGNADILISTQES